MSVALWILLAIFIVGAVGATIALLAPKRIAAQAAALKEPAPLEPAAEPPASDWTAQAGEEFAGLSEPARCDLIFAVAALDDARSHQLLVHALDDPSEAVALAAAHALARNGRGGDLDAYASAHPGARADTLVSTLALLD
ncbi:MAG: hypothetical protein M3R35_03605 [Candidatus Eremiobacteraeota bacterium]|nr:hypothetical protein [Candidatus Eremiobacteraeota bacterium]